MSAQETLHKIVFCCYNKIQWCPCAAHQKMDFVIKKRSFETLKQSCSSGLKVPLSSHKEERPLRFQYVTDAQTARKGLHHTWISWQRVLCIRWSTSFQWVFCHVWKSQHLKLTSLQLENKGQLYICIKSLKLTIKTTPFGWICLTILIATLYLKLSETWHNLDMHSPIFIIGVRKGNGRIDKRQSPNRGNIHLFSWTHQLQVHEAHHLDFEPNAGSN